MVVPLPNIGGGQQDPDSAVAAKVQKANAAGDELDASQKLCGLPQDPDSAVTAKGRKANAVFDDIDNILVPPKVVLMGTSGTVSHDNDPTATSKIVQKANAVVDELDNIIVPPNVALMGTSGTVTHDNNPTATSKVVQMQNLRQKHKQQRSCGEKRTIVIGSKVVCKKKSRKNNKAALRKEKIHELPSEKVTAYYAGVDVMDCRLMSIGCVDSSNNIPECKDTDVLSTLLNSKNCIDESLEDAAAAAVPSSLKIGIHDKDEISTVLNSANDASTIAAASLASSATPTITDDITSDMLNPKFTKVVNLDDYINVDTIEAGSTKSVSRDEHFAMNIATVQKKPVVVECFIDVVDVGNLKCSGCAYILRLVDPFTRFGIAIPLKSLDDQVFLSQFIKLLSLARVHPTKIYYDNTTKVVIQLKNKYPYIEFILSEPIPLMTKESTRFHELLLKWRKENGSNFLSGISVVQAVCNTLSLE